MPDDEALRKSFDAVARLYDEVRPGYPEPIIDAIVRQAGLVAGGRILEIGCGTGQITRSFARRGYTVLALELGPALAALAAERLRAYQQVHILPMAFEKWPVEREAFDLVLSAQAFHWIEPKLGLARAAQALAPTGAIAPSTPTSTKLSSRSTIAIFPQTTSGATSIRWRRGRCATTPRCGMRKSSLA